MFDEPRKNCRSYKCNDATYEENFCERHFDFWEQIKNQFDDAEETIMNCRADNLVYGSDGKITLVNYKGLQDKKCKLCKVVKPVIKFSLRSDTRTRNGKVLSSYCKQCSRVYNTAHVYGFSREELSALVIAANDTCESCGQYSESLVVDHDHACCNIVSATNPACGKCVRGLICNKCNTGIGMMETNNNLTGVIKYLEAHDPNNKVVQLIKEYS